MAMAVFRCSFPLLISLLMAVVVAGAVQKQDKSNLRTKESEALNENAVQDPEEVVSMVEMSMRNSTERRKLGYFSFGTGNPIDDCWRCDPNWQKNRKRLADCGIGFGRNAIGGRDGRFYMVTDSGDDDPVNPQPGTLRHAVIQDEPLWIVFKSDMAIKLKQELIMNSFKTIDARGVNVHIANGLIQRMPRCRHGYFHVVNNDYTHWEMYAIGGSANPTINSQGNRYLAPVNPFAKEVTKRVDTATSQWHGWNWRSEGDLLLNGAYFIPSGAGASSSYTRASSLGAKSSSMVGTITSGAGVLGCRRGHQC
ncbi:hypothetical protein L1987_45845 [Smallanthus sonchifolius]|uniref:Uncharacterized protein n=1 Tax=Smallanthus sonchifolius TaxID=185202 RepID=A0ACB9FXW3_9ASTR|nr:hypothetical protein L1987_45845 [Smallanthus sonchifolius]